MFTMSPLTCLKSITNWRFIFFNGLFWTFLCHDYNDKLILSALNSTSKFMSGSERSRLEMSATILIGVTITKLNSRDKLTVDSLINVEKKWEKLEGSFLSPQLNIPTSIILLCMLCSHFPPRPLHSHSNAVTQQDYIQSAGQVQVWEKISNYFPCAEIFYIQFHSAWPMTINILL